MTMPLANLINMSHLLSQLIHETILLNSSMSKATNQGRTIALMSVEPLKEFQRGGDWLTGNTLWVLQAHPVNGVANTRR